MGDGRLYQARGRGTPCCSVAAGRVLWSMCLGGAGGAQMFKEPEKGNKDINIERIDEALALEPNIVASSCPFCMTMLSDGVKNYNKEQEVKVLDIAEITVRANGL